MITNTIHLLKENAGPLLLSGVIPNNLHEQDYDNGRYYACVCIAPKREKIMGFEGIYRAVKSKFGGLLLPAYLLVSNGTFGSYFVLYIRKEGLYV